MSGIDGSRRPVLIIVGIWVVLVWLALFSRHLLTVDETRYIGVAWEMWLRGDLLVPHLNGEPYHHKPPLLFWLINLSWKLFGVSEWAARLVPAVAGLAGALLAIPLAGLLWPRQTKAASLAAWTVLTTMLWTFWTTAMMFDLLATVCAEIALLGILMAWRGMAAAGWGVTGLGIGLGVLAKGPVILVYVLPAAVFAPWWMKEQRPSSWVSWYGGAASALVLGAAIGLSWALPAAAAGGEDYSSHILWGQTAGRMVESFAHRRPFWWYLPLLPVLLFPWSLWSPLWRGVRERWRRGWDSGERFALTVAGSGLMIFSLISGKQVHYLLPVFPALALFGARALTDAGDGRQVSHWAIGLPAAPLLLVGLAFIALPYIDAFDEKAEWLRHLPAWIGVPIVGAVMLAMLIAPRVPVAVWPGVLSLVSVIAFYPGAFREIAGHYDVVEIAALVGEQQALERPVAFVGKYMGEFGFAGRLKAPVEAINRGSVASWANAHPDGLIVHRSGDSRGPDDKGIHYWQPYRGSYLVLRDVSALRPAQEAQID